MPAAFAFAAIDSTSPLVNRARTHEDRLALLVFCGRPPRRGFCATKTPFCRMAEVCSALIAERKLGFCLPCFPSNAANAALSSRHWAKVGNPSP